MPDPTARENQTGMHLGAHLHHQGFTAEQVEAMEPEVLHAHARAAGQGRAPSGGTMTAATSFMRKLAAPPPDDPFAGL